MACTGYMEVALRCVVCMETKPAEGCASSFTALVHGATPQQKCHDNLARGSLQCSSRTKEAVLRILPIDTNAHIIDSRRRTLY